MSSGSPDTRELNISDGDSGIAMLIEPLGSRHPSRRSTAAGSSIGDMPTDVPMFGVASVDIAMGNAGQEVQHYARFTTSNQEQGFAHAVDAFVLRLLRPE